MEKEVRVKSINYAMYNIGIFVALIFIMIAVLMSIYSHSYTAKVCGLSIFIPLSVCLIIFIICNSIFTAHYDIYTNDGFRHEHKGKVVYETTWDNVYCIRYTKSILWNLTLRHSRNLLIVDLVSPIHIEQGFWSLREDYGSNNIVNYVGKQKLKEIINVVPDNIADLLKDLL